MSRIIDTDKVADILRDVAATYILPRFKSLENDEVNTKTGATDLVTIADIEAEEALDHRLPEKFSGSTVIGEESVSKGIKSMDALLDDKGTIWVVDPVDGTYNFVHGREQFAIMLACVIDGVTEYGWIYDIPGDRMMIAEKGSGVTINGKSCKLSSDDIGMEDAKGYAGRKYFPKYLKPHVDALDDTVASLSSLSCAGHEYLRLITGERSFSIYSKTRAWDHLAGSLAVNEAGGLSQKWDKTPYCPGDEFGGIINARNEELWHALHDHTISKMIDSYKEKKIS